MAIERDHSGLLVVRERCVAVLEGVNDQLLNNPTLLLKIGSLLATIDLGLDIQKNIDHRFPPRNGPHHGATQGFILGESHLIWSTWPERGEIDFDIFSCSPDVDLARAPIYLTRRYNPSRIRFVMIPEPPYIPMPAKSR